jgi:hypothetical protein
MAVLQGHIKMVKLELQNEKRKITNGPTNQASSGSLTWRHEF